MQILGAANFALIAVGTGALAIVARHVGAREMAKAEEAVQQSVLAAIAVAILVALPVAIFAPQIIGVFHVEPGVVEAGTPFVRRVMMAVPAEAVFFVIASGLRGAGDTRTPLVIGAITAALSVSAAWVLIFGRLGLPALGVTGAATATAIGFTVGALLGVVLLARGKLVLCSHWRPFVVRWDMIRRVLNVGYPAALEHLLVQLGFFVYVYFVAHHGTAPVAAYFIGVRILALSFLPGFGFAAAAGTMVGQSLGAGRPLEAERSGWAALELAFYMMSAAGVVIYLAARPIARLFVDDPAVVESAVGFIHVLALAHPLMALDFTLGGALRGAGDTRFPLLTALLGI